MQPVDLTGKRILLTGASSGIGAAATKQFGLHRAVVVAVARRKDLLDAVADRITGDGGTAMSLPCDLSDMEAIDALVEDVEKRIGGIDILINNAGRSIRRPLAESLERWHDVERTMVLNYYAPLRLIRGLAPGMLERGDGHPSGWSPPPAPDRCGSRLGLPSPSTRWTASVPAGSMHSCSAATNSSTLEPGPGLPTLGRRRAAT